MKRARISWGLWSIFLISPIFLAQQGGFKADGRDFPIRIKTTEPLVVAFMKYQGPYSEIPRVFEMVRNWIQEKGYDVVGSPRTVYYNNPQEVPPESLLWEIQWPIAEEVPASPTPGKIKIKPLPPEKVVFTYYKGPHEEVGKVYGMLYRWLGERGYFPAGPPREICLRDPKKTKVKELLTEIQIPIRKK